jgi:uncharacterized damage-inducible protein DinB
MRETARIIDELERAVAGDPWHGPSVHAALDGVDVTIATARPAPDVHTICELVLHMTSWTREVARRLHAGVAEDPADGDWPVCTLTTARQWDAALKAFDVANVELREAIAALDDSQLDDRIGDVRDPALGSGVSRYVTLHGLAQHHAYHAGQISLLKRMVSGRR